MIRLFLVLSTLLPCIVTCPYPDDLIGEWYSTSFGTLTFTSTTFTGFTSTGVFATPLTFTCYAQEGNRYVSQSSVSLFGASVGVYLCMNLVRLSSIKYYFTLDSNLDIEGVRFYTSNSLSVSVAEACNVTDTRSPGEYELLILKASINDAVVACPNSFTSIFNVTMTTSTVTGCESSMMDGSSRNALSYNYSSCASGLFNSGGIQLCLHHIVSGNGYLITYNNDTSTDETSTFRFTCYTYYKYGAILYTTEHPRSCHVNQTTTYVVSPGITYVMTDIYYQAPEEDSTNLGLILGLVFGIIGLIILIVVAILLYRIFCRKKPEPPPPPKVRKKKRKLSITEYSPNLSLRSVSSEKNGIIKKQSTGEILTGSSITERKLQNLDSEAGYEPPEKQKWQKSWERKFRAGTPAVPVSVGRSDVHCTANGFVRSEADALSKSTSLPDSLDRTPRRSARREKLKIEALDLDTSRSSTPRYSDRSHSSPKIPESTGKFGLQLSFRSDATKLMPNPLQTITENPLSRENTAVQGDPEYVPKTPKTVGTLGTFPRAHSSITASQSTVSAGDVRFSSLSKFSHLSASNESIFDDPRWLTKDIDISENAFEVGKNLLPGLPKKSVMDQKAFLKIPVTGTQHSREDMDYMRNKTMQSVGIKASLQSERAPSSQKIVENEKKKKKRKGESSKPKIVRPSTPISPHFED